MKKIFIDYNEINENNYPYIIAEISGNHNSDLNKALQLIEEAKECGASAVKIQTFTPDCLTLNTDKPEFKITSGLWSGYNLYELYEKTQTPFNWHEALFAKAKSCNITLFSSPFSLKSLKFISQFKPAAYKIASNELHDWALVEKIAEKQKPIIISSGVVNLEELENTVNLIRSKNNHEIIILHCISAYPADSKDANLKTILYLKKKFNTIIGFSDHTLGSIASCSAITMGASIIEKHFILDRNEGGPDSAFSLEPKEFKNFVRKCRMTWETIGKVKFASRDKLLANTIYIRQLWTTKNIKKGEKLGWHNLRSIRGPSQIKAISSMDYKIAMNNKVNKNLLKHSPLLKQDIEEN